METELEAPDAGSNTDAPEQMIVRTFASEVTAGDGRTIDVRIVPYGEQITHNDGFGGVPVGVPYTEEWRPGAFAGQTRAANRVLVNFEHQKGIAGIVGHGLMLREESDGLYGSFRLHDTPDGDKVLLLVREGITEGVSLEVPPRSVRSVRTVAGVVQRVKAHLKGIALCREPAYAGARVLALREASTPIFDEELLPLAIDPELVARCERLGIALPERMKAHPAPDTPAESGTPEDGTRQDGDPTDLEA